jgi:hypothetical protein
LTRIYGYALDPESGHPLPRKQVRANLFATTRATLQGPVADGSDAVNSDTDGRWELNLLPTAGSGRCIRLRCSGAFDVYVDIPVAVTGGAGDTTPIDVSTLLVDPTTLNPITTSPSVYLPRVLLGAANGVASLGSDGILTPAQRPPVDPTSGLIGAPVVDGAEFDVTVVSNWGIDPSGNAYYNSAGADPADAAIATLGADGHILLTDTRGGSVTVPVTSVNGRVGVVTGLAEQVDLDALASSTTTALAGKASTAYATSRAVAMALVLGS